MQLIHHADTAGSEMLWYVQEFKKSGSIDSIAEVRHALTELHAVVDELYSDCQARNMIV
jgi:hypothetical protein